MNHTLNSVTGERESVLTHTNVSVLRELADIAVMWVEASWGSFGAIELEGLLGQHWVGGSEGFLQVLLRASFPGRTLWYPFRSTVTTGLRF